MRALTTSINGKEIKMNTIVNMIAFYILIFFTYICVQLALQIILWLQLYNFIRQTFNKRSYEYTKSILQYSLKKIK